MRVDSFNPVRLTSSAEAPVGTSLASRPVAPTTGPTAGEAPGPEAAGGESFSQVLGKALGQVNDLLVTADRQAQQVATGQADNLHDSLIAMAQADLALQVTMRVTQKAIAAYQEISRMQI